MAKDKNKSIKNQGHPIIEKLTGALQADGDFPVRAGVVEEMRELASDPSLGVHRFTETILREPSLGTRVLHLVNHAYFNGTAPIVTISQAVIQIGSRNIVDLCAGLVLMQKFDPATQKGSTFADGIKKTILTSLIAKELVIEDEDKALPEQAYIASSFYTLSYLLLAYYFPQVYEVVDKRARERDLTLEKSLSEVLGIQRSEITLAIVDSLQVPELYRESVIGADNVETEDASITSQAIRAADLISEAITLGSDESAIIKVLDALEDYSPFEEEELLEVIYNLPELFDQHCESIGFSSLSLPSWFVKFGDDGEPGTQRNKIPNLNDENEDSDYEELLGNFPQYLDEVTEVVNSNEPISSIVTTAMETIAFGLSFDRVILLMADNSNTALVGRMALGREIKNNAKNIVKPIADKKLKNSAAIQAFNKGELVLTGTPLLEDAKLFMALPIGDKKSSIGVIYADLTNTEVTPGLAKKLETNLSILKNLVNQALEGVSD